MRAATLPIQRPRDAKLLAIDAQGNLSHRRRTEIVDLLRPGDVVIANDAATLPASLSGLHLPSGREIEVRLAGRSSFDVLRHFSAVVFGAGDFRMLTEDRPSPPPLAPGDALSLGPLRATVASLLGHPRLIRLHFDGADSAIREGIARHGRPIQYSHVPTPLDVWDTWTPLAGPPVAFEPPSAGFALDWNVLSQLAARGVAFATLTHAAGISSTGDPQLDARLPFDEPYRIPPATARSIEAARRDGRRIIAVGTTVVRALEHAASLGSHLRPGDGIATQRIGPETRLRVVDAIISGTHQPGTSHYELLRAFAPADTLERATQQLNAHDYRTHEFGDSIFLEKAARPVAFGFLFACGGPVLEAHASR